MKKILIIDDSKSIRDYLKEKIDSVVCDRCRIIEASDGLEGIKLAEVEKPDIVFIDVVMPKLNGYATAIKLKNSKNFTPVLIAMTSEQGDDVEKKMLAICHDFIPKPIDEDTLFQKLKKYLNIDLVEEKKVDKDSFDAIANEIVIALQEKVEELTRLNKELQQKNITIKSLYVETEKAKSKLEALVKFRQHFLDFIFHEIKGPLTSILGNAELLQLRFFSELGFEGNEILNNIITSSERIKSLMEQMAKFSSFNFEFKLDKSVSLLKAIDEVLLRYRDYIKERELSVVVNCSDDIRLMINKNFLIEIIDPIIRNAIIFNVEGGVMEITCFKTEEGVKLMIKDSGIGMEKHQIEQAFIPFVQFIDVEHYRTHKLKGLGLGLSMCKKMVEMVNGSLQIESEKGKGTTVKIHFREYV